MRRARRIGAGAIALVLLLLVPRPALACPVCFGAVDSPMFDAMTLAVVALLGVTVVVLGGFAAFFIYLIRQSRRAELPPSPGYARQGGHP